MLHKVFNMREVKYKKTVVLMDRDVVVLITRVIEEINFKLQELGKKIDDFDYLETLKKNGFVSSDIEILNTIGDKKRMFHLALYSKHELKERIERIVNKKILIKVYPQLEIDKNYSDSENIECLKLLGK